MKWCHWLQLPNSIVLPLYIFGLERQRTTNRRLIFHFSLVHSLSLPPFLCLLLRKESNGVYLLKLQSLPAHPESQKQVPPKQRPWPEQPLGHVASDQRKKRISNKTQFFNFEVSFFFRGNTKLTGFVDSDVVSAFNEPVDPNTPNRVAGIRYCDCDILVQRNIVIFIWPSRRIRSLIIRKSNTIKIQTNTSS
jgi:hypothetical protein